MQSTMYKCSGRTLTPEQAAAAPDLLQYIAGMQGTDCKKALVTDTSDATKGTAQLEIELQDGTVFLVS